MPIVVMPPEEVLVTGLDWYVEGSTEPEVEVPAAAAGETRRAEETSTAAADARRVRFM
jgi:hypothetical protein